MRLDEIAPVFIRDGSWRDIYVLETDRKDWRCLGEALRRSALELRYSIAGEPAEMPQNLDDAFDRSLEAARPMLRVQAGRVGLNCHFFSPDEIEFDLDPSAVECQEDLESLLQFLRLVGKATSKDVRLTPENHPTSLYLLYRVSANCFVSHITPDDWDEFHKASKSRQP